MWQEEFVEVLFQMWGRTAGGGRQWAERWEWSLQSLTYSHSLLSLLLLLLLHWSNNQTSETIYKMSICHTEPTLNKLPYDIQHRTILWWIATSGLFTILLVFFPIASKVVQLPEWCVGVLLLLWAPGFFSLIRNSFHFRALMLAIKSTPQHYQSTEPPSTCKPIHLLPTLHPSPTSSLAEKIEDMP